jgi:hypothetical protein
MAGAPKGNKNAAKKRLPWSQALKRSLTRLAADNGEQSPNYRRGLDKVADAVVRDAADGNKDAWMELGNRLEGKPGQTVILQGDEDNPVRVNGTVNFIDSSTKD